MLAETATGGTSRVTAIVFRPGTDTLSLVAEALALLPLPLRWQVTFSTYFTKLPPEVECQWRFVLANSTEAKALERSPHTVTINLCNPLRPTPDGPWVEAARTGMAPKQVITEVVRQIAQAPSAPVAQPVILIERAGKAQLDDGDWGSMQHVWNDVSVMPRLQGSHQVQRVRRRKGFIWIVVGTIAAGLLIAAWVFPARWLGRQTNPINEIASAAKQKQADADGPKDAPAARKPRLCRLRSPKARRQRDRILTLVRQVTGMKLWFDQVKVPTLRSQLNVKKQPPYRRTLLQRRHLCPPMLRALTPHKVHQADILSLQPRHSRAQRSCSTFRNTSMWRVSKKKPRSIATFRQSQN